MRGRPFSPEVEERLHEMLALELPVRLIAAQLNVSVQAVYDRFALPVPPRYATSKRGRELRTARIKRNIALYPNKSLFDGKGWPQPK